MKSLVNCEKPAILGLVLRTAAEENYVSLNLVHSCWVNRGGDREIGDARAHDDFLDDRARHHRVDHRWRCDSYVCAAGKRTISPCGSYFFNPGRDPGSLHLLQTEDSFSQGLISRSRH